jgi:hypothetical protein
MIGEFGSYDWRGRKLREWLLHLLRYAVTREPSDRTAALAVAAELDSLDEQWRPAAPRFFLKTTEEVCSAIPASAATRGSLFYSDWWEFGAPGEIRTPDP